MIFTTKMEMIFTIKININLILLKTWIQNLVALSKIICSSIK